MQNNCRARASFGSDRFSERWRREDVFWMEFCQWYASHEGNYGEMEIFSGL